MKEEALKLADELDKYKGIVTRDAANMLRQQQVEIENLKAGLLSHNDIYCEPTAWINHIQQTGGDFYELNVSGRGEPLYRHPPQTKPLSDEEILDMSDSYIENQFELAFTGEGLVEYVRAVMKKASGQ